MPQFPKPRLAAGIALAVVAYAALRMALIKILNFNIDEAEHLQAAWNLAQGRVLYKDFFEHHGPLWYLLLEPVPKIVLDPVAALYAGRALMGVFWGGMLLLQTRLGSPETGRRTRLLSTLFLASFSTFGLRSTQIRPDTAAGLAVSAVLVLGQGTLGAAGWAIMGALSGTALFISPKIIFVTGGYATGLWFYHRKDAGLRGPALFLAGAAMPMMAVLAYEWRLGALHEFWTWFVVFNYRLRDIYPWNMRGGPVSSLIENPALWALGLAGLWRERATPRGWAFGAALAAVPFIKPFPFNWYFLLVAPLLGLFAAEAFVAGMAAVRAPFLRFSLAGMVAVGVLVSFGFQIRALRDTADDTKARIRCVQEQTGPSDAILDVYSGYALFRPSPSFFIWLNPDIQATLGAVRVDGVLFDALNQPQCRGFILNPGLLRRYPRAAAFGRDHYHGSRCADLYLRN